MWESLQGIWLVFLSIVKILKNYSYERSCYRVQQVLGGVIIEVECKDQEGYIYKKNIDERKKVNLVRFGGVDFLGGRSGRYLSLGLFWVLQRFFFKNLNVQWQSVCFFNIERRKKNVSGI